MLPPAILRVNMVPMLVAMTLASIMVGQSASHDPFGVPYRPRDVWVYRAELDNKPGMVVVAVHKNLSVAFDPTRCNLYEVWPGGLTGDRKLTTQGATYIKSNVGDETWQAIRGNQTLPVRPVFRGYKFSEGQVNIMYDLTFDGGVAHVVETPEFFSAPAGKVGYERKIVTSGLPAGTSLAVITTHSVYTEFNVVGDIRSSIGKGGEARLGIKPNAKTTIRYTFGQEGVSAGPDPLPAPLTTGGPQTADPSWRQRPGDMAPLDSVNPAFDLSQAGIGSFKGKVGAITFQPDGKMLICNDEPSGEVFVATAAGTNADFKLRRVAAGLDQPTGIAVTDSGMYVLQGTELTQLVDNDKDGIADEYRCVASGWPEDVGRRATGLTYDSKLKTFATSLRGAGAGQVSAMKITPDGRFETSRSDALSKPVAWLPGVSSAQAPADFVPLDFGPYRGQVAVSDGPGLDRMFTETVDGTEQGGIVRFSGGIGSTIERTSVGPDGALYLGGNGTLQRLTYNNKPAFEILRATAMTNGFQLEFTQPLAQGVGETPGYYPTTTWPIGPETGAKTLVPRSVTVSGDRKSAFLEYDGLQDGSIVAIRVHPSAVSENGSTLVSTQVFYTLSNTPSNKKGRVVYLRREPANVLTRDEAKEGFQLLFEGRTLENWRGYRRTDIPRAWFIEDGAVSVDSSKGEGGDLITKDTYGDFELRFQWKVMTTGGNSGVIYRCTEEEDASYKTGPEYQVLDNEKSGDGRLNITSAGSCYGLFGPKADYTRPVGEWNEGKIIVRGSKVEHWLNGHLTVSFDMASPEFEDKVAHSKFEYKKNFAKATEGHIALQDHGFPAMYRNIRIKRL